jgi:hypothetical protein
MEWISSYLDILEDRDKFTFYIKRTTYYR